MQLYRVSQKKHSYKFFGLEIMLFTCSQTLWSGLRSSFTKWGTAPAFTTACKTTMSASRWRAWSLVQKFYKSVFSGTPCSIWRLPLTPFIPTIDFNLWIGTKSCKFVILVIFVQTRTFLAHNIVSTKTLLTAYLFLLFKFSLLRSLKTNCSNFHCLAFNCGWFLLSLLNSL